MAIKLLEDSLINKIAAGEVIERPSSIVKELIENSLDAGAEHILIRVENAGMDSIEVADDGIGMSREDIAMAFLRHATSKIDSEDDLFKIMTMGFRGEALPSIASVSRIDIYTSLADGEGTHGIIDAGIVEKLYDYPCPKGTNIIVRDLFYNTPVRRKFLKSPVSEGNHIYDVVTKYALARPDISFTYASGQKTYFKTPGNNSLWDTAFTLYGKDFVKPLLEISYSSEKYSLTGLISPPEIKRVNRKNQFFFVNQRPIRSPMLYKAIDNAYQGLLLSHEYPVIFLFLQLPLDEIDVNVHPQKSEIRFENEQEVFRLVSNVLRDYVQNRDYQMTITSKAFVPGNYSCTEKTVADLTKNKHKQFINEASLDFIIPETPGLRENPSSWAKMSVQSEFIIDESRWFKVIGQCMQSYILFEMDNSLYLMDQHAAHERIIYEQLQKQYASQSIDSQTIAFPQEISLPASRMEIMENNMDFLAYMGFEVQPMGPESAVLRGAPAIFKGNEIDILIDLLDLLSTGEQVNINNKAMTLMSCKRAIKAGQCLSLMEMERIITDLFQVENYQNCPHGRPTLLKMSRAELDRMFKR